MSYCPLPVADGAPATVAEPGVAADVAVVAEVAATGGCTPDFSPPWMVQAGPPSVLDPEQITFL